VDDVYAYALQNPAWISILSPATPIPPAPSIPMVADIGAPVCRSFRLRRLLCPRVATCHAGDTVWSVERDPLFRL